MIRFLFSSHCLPSDDWGGGRLAKEEGVEKMIKLRMDSLWKWLMLLIRKAGIEYLNWILKQLNTKYFISQLASSSIQSQFAQD